MSSDPLAQLLSPVETPHSAAIVWDLSMTRALDIVFGVIALLILMPLMTLIALAIKLEDGGRSCTLIAASGTAAALSPVSNSARWC